jgi:U3 small nucleolar RNA-associated protein 4
MPKKGSKKPASGKRHASDIESMAIDSEEPPALVKAPSPTKKAGISPRRLVAHRCNLVNWLPSGITALAFDAAWNFLAVGRENGMVEIWSTGSWHCVQRVISGGASAAETVCWSPDGKVLSAGLQGVITTWDLSLTVASSFTDSYGGAVWSMDFEKRRSLLAVGCEDGCVRLFDYAAANSDNLIYKCALSRFDGRALCVSWTPDGQAVFAGGSDGTIRRWSVPVDTAHIVPTSDMIMSTNTGGDSAESTAIWCLDIAAEDTVVTGDSSGMTKFWDGRFGALIQEFKGHGADVLALFVGQDI